MQGWDCWKGGSRCDVEAANQPVGEPASYPLACWFADWLAPACWVGAAAVVADYDWGEELYRTGGAGGVAGAGDRGGDGAAGGAAVLFDGELSLPAGAGERTYRRLRGVHRHRAGGGVEAAAATDWPA